MAKKKRRQREHPLYAYSYEDEVTFECPVRGTVTQKVTVKRYNSPLQEAEKAALRSQSDIDELIDDDILYDDDDTEMED